MSDCDKKDIENQENTENEDAVKNQEAVLFDEITVLERSLDGAEMALAENIMVNWNSF